MANQFNSERIVSPDRRDSTTLQLNHNQPTTLAKEATSINDSPASLKIIGEAKPNSMSSNNSNTSLYKSINNIKNKYLNDDKLNRTDNNDLSNSVSNSGDTVKASPLTKKIINLSERLNNSNNTGNKFFIPNEPSAGEHESPAPRRHSSQVVQERAAGTNANEPSDISSQRYKNAGSRPPKWTENNNLNDIVDYKNNTSRSDINKMAADDNRNNESSDNQGDDDDENNDDGDDDDANDDDDDEDENRDRKNEIIFPGYVPKAFNYFTQSSQPRYICLKMITSPWFERISMLVILINCLTLGLYQPCNDNPCQSTRCVILQYLDHGIFIFFAIEMCIKILAMGLIGKETYLAETWNRLDLFIVVAGTVEYLVASENLSLSAIRTVRVLRPLRAINRVPSMRILVMLLLDTLPMLGNVLLLCFFVFFIFGIIGVQLWKGVLRNRCFYDFNSTYDLEATSGKNMYYAPEFTDSFICTEGGGGMATCDDIPPFINSSRICNGTIDLLKIDYSLSNNSIYANECVNWNAYYTKCRPSDKNPFKGAISFDNIGYAWVAIFQIISLESWVTIMYYIQDAHSFWNWIYFVFLIVIGSFFMINLCLVVIATQFSETKRRETERMIAERRRFSRSSSTLISDANDPGSCWEELLRFIEHFVRKSKRRVMRAYAEYREQRRLRQQDAKQLQKPIELRENVSLLNETEPNADLSQVKLNNEPIKSNSLSARAAQLQSDQDSIRNNQSDSVKSSHANHANNKENSSSPLNDDNSDNPGRGTTKSSNIKIYRNISESSFKRKTEYLKATRFCHFFSKFRYNLKVFVDSRFFQRAILCAILVNTLSMGVEHHEQPPLLTLIVEYSNIFFTVVFCVEMLLKIFAYGPFDYIKNAFNLFDGAIVGISLYEVVKQLSVSRTGSHEAIAPSGVSVLRTFRLLRILKLVRFMPALRRQLVVMLKTIDNVATFFSLLILFIFIFSILGMNLFGCKFCTKDSDGVRVCERKNFDSLLWAIITVFQVLTQEDWNEVLYNGMEKTSSWAALYFIALMTFGNYVLFNLLVAILVEGFSTEDEPKRAIEEQIRLDAIQAIEEEDRQRELIQKARKNSKASASLHDADNQSSKSAQKVPQISVSSAFPDETRLGKIDDFSSITHLVSDPPRLNQVESLAASGQVNKMKLPIITHTCPTPNQTPSNSSRNLPLFSNYELEFDMKMSRTNPERLLGRYERRFSLDSSRDMLKLKRFVSKANSSKIYDRTLRTKKVLFFSNNNLESARPSRPGASHQNEEPTPANSPATKHLLKKNRRASSIKVKTVSSLEIPPTHIHRYSRSKSEKHKSRSLRQPSERLSRLSSQTSQTSRFEKLNEEPVVNDFTETLSNVTCSSSKIQNPASQVEQQMSEINETEKLLSPKSDMSINVQTNMTKREPMRMSSSSEHSRPSQRIALETPRSATRTSFGEDEEEMIDFDCCAKIPKPTGCFKTREEYALYLLSKENKLRLFCLHVTTQKWFDYTILLFIACNCITLAMERPSIPPNSIERKFLTHSNYLFTFIFAIEMIIKVLAHGFYIGESAYLKSGWNIMDGFLVIISTIDVIVTLSARSSPKIFGILRVFRLLRTLRPLRVISRAPGLKLVVQTLLSSLRPIGNIVLICCTFFIIFGILGVQLFKGKMYKCVGDLTNVKTKEDCLSRPGNQWINSQYNFDNLGQALMALFVLSSKDGWVSIMYTGIDAVGVDKQPVENYNEWMLLYFISFLLLVGFFVLNMFVGVVIENFHKCREEQEREEKARRAAKRAKKFEEKRRRMKELPYYASYSRTRRMIHDICDSKYFDLVIAGVIGLNVVSMSVEFYMMPPILDEILDILNYIFTVIFLVEAIMRLVALGFIRYIREKWNQLDIIIVILSIVGILFDKLSSKSAIPINPTIIRVMRVLRIARVLKLLKMAKGIRSLLDTVIQALPQVGNLGLLFFLLFFIFAILGVELFGKLNCESIRSSCDGLSRHAHFHNFGMAFLTLFRIATGDNWNGIMKDTLRDNVLCHDDANPGATMCLASILAPIYFVIFVLMAQFVLVNVVVAVLMKHLDDSNKMMADDAEMDEEIERQLEAEARNNIKDDLANKMDENFNEDGPRMMYKQTSLPPNFTFDTPYDMQSKYSSTETQLNSEFKKPTKSILNKRNFQTNRIPNFTDDSSISEIQNSAPTGQKPTIQLTLYDDPKSGEEKFQNDYKSACMSDTSSFEGETDLSLNQLDMSVHSGPGMRPRKKSLSNQSSEPDRALSPSSSINYESDNVSTIMRQRFMQNRIRVQNDQMRASLGPAVTFKDHFSPKTSLKIKVIDETDTETEQLS